MLQTIYLFSKKHVDIDALWVIIVIFSRLLSVLVGEMAFLF